jgi:hypothetical protein
MTSPTSNADYQSVATQNGLELILLIFAFSFTFVFVTGLTKSIQAGENGGGTPQSNLLREWFPNSHFLHFEPFKRRDQPATNADILEHEGIRLLQTLLECSECTDAKHRLVFFGHDLGGSVIKKALILATESLRYRTIAETTRAIFFFASLHQAKGSEGEGGWERHLANLLSVSQKDVQQVFGDIQTLPTALSMLSDSFINISGSYDMFNVYESSRGQPVSLGEVHAHASGHLSIASPCCHFEDF